LCFVKQREPIVCALLSKWSLGLCFAKQRELRFVLC